MNIELMGELLVQTKLVEHGWHPLPLNTSQTACNADLIAVNGLRRVSIQVKTTDAINKPHSHSHSMFFGYAAGYLENGTPFFNSKESPPVADVIVAVNYAGAESRFVVLPVALAEKLCRSAADYWSSVRKRNGETRKPSFPIYLALKRVTTRSDHVAQDERVRRNLEAFENEWRVLCEPSDKLHDGDQWPME
jgi:hypothetical protein